MTVEVAHTIYELNQSYPRNVDLIREGDDHIRLVKKTTKNTFPNITGAVNFSSEKLNNLDKSVDAVDKDGNITFNKSVTIKRGGSFSVTGARVESVGDAKEEDDAITLGQVLNLLKDLREASAPIGHIHFTSNKSFNPKAHFGIGEWELINVGKAIIGAGNEYNPDGGLKKEWKTDEVYGNATHTLTSENLPSRSLTISGETSSDGGHYHGFGGDDQLDSGLTLYNNERFRYDAESGTSKNDARYFRTTTEGVHKHKFEGTTSKLGEDKPIDLLPPSMALYIWERIK